MKLSVSKGESPVRAGVPVSNTGQAVPGSEVSGKTCPARDAGVA